MTKLLIIVLILNFITRNGICDDDIFFNYDYSVFKGEDGKSILEIYYSVNQYSLTYIKNENNFEAGALIDIQITDISSNNIIYSNIYKSPSVVSDTSKEKNNQKLIGQVNYILGNGNYKLFISGSDFYDSTRKDEFQNEITIKAGDLENVRLSDIELASSIKKAPDSKSPFYKNTLEIIPNPSGLFGMSLNELFYYFEIYGLTPENISEEFILNYSINDLNNVNVISFNKAVKRKGDSKADYGKIIIDSLKRGSYILKVTILDSSKNLNLSNEKKFYLFNTSSTVPVSSEQNDYLKSEYPAMTKEEVEDEFDKMIYIVTLQDEKRFESLESLNDKKKFLYEFWKSKDVNPETQVLETKVAYMKRYNEANKYYKEAYTEGWKTDRGRIYIIYGKPEDVERYPFESQTKSYEIWKYETIQGGGECVFIEIQTSTGVYRLVHSTFRHELKNEQWREQLSKY